MPDASANFQKTVETGLEEVQRTHSFLTDTLASVLAEQGHALAADLLRGTKSDKQLTQLGSCEVQALSYSFQLLNLAEEHIANKVRRIREAQPGARPEAGHWFSYLSQLKERGMAPSEVRLALRELQVEPVFTKHPTEAKNWSVLALHREVTRLLAERDAAATPFEERRCALHLRAVMERLWLTGEVFSRKPEVADELDNLVYYLREVFPSVFTQLDERLHFAWERVWQDEEPLTAEDLPGLRFGSWVGGDRDGHPKVTAGVTRSTLHRLRREAIKVVRKRLRKLSRELSFRPDTAVPPQDLLEALPAEPEEGASRMAPWRAYVMGLSRQLEELDAPTLLEKLRGLAGWLTGAGAGSTVNYHVRPILRLVECFGLHLARLDVRQNSDFYARSLSQLMQSAGIPGAESYPNWPEEQKLAFLEAELAHTRPLAHQSVELPPEAEETRATLSALAEQRDQFGLEGLGVLVVSMTRSLSDLLAVYVLCKEVGLAHQVDGCLRCDLPVVPLFETFEDLQCAPGIVDAFLAHPVTRHSLAASGHPRMIIMLGYSDSNKDTGIIGSQWALHRAQQELDEVRDRHAVDITYFHGRGGTVGRGAGPTHRFLEALPHRALDGGLRITEQGEVIGQKYNTPGTAAANLEWLAAGSLGGRLLARQNREPEWMGACMEQLVNSSRAAYRELLEREGFMSFYRQATPIDAIEQSRIGSRPSRRTGQPTLADLRAIPWVFSWNQSRYYLPGWYGVGSALRHLQEADATLYQQLRDSLQSVSFLRYLFYNVESSLASSDESLMRAYAGLVSDASVGNRFLDTILAERRRTQEALATLLGGDLHQRRPRFCRTLEARDADLRLLHLEQIRLLRMFREEVSPSRQTMEALLLVLNAIASGLRTTG